MLPERLRHPVSTSGANRRSMALVSPEARLERFLWPCASRGAARRQAFALTTIRMLAPWRPGRPSAVSRHASRSRESRWRCVAAPAGASVFGPRAGHSPNADEIRTAYWVAIVVGALLIVAVHVFLIAALLRFRAGRGRSPQRFTAGARAFVRPAAPLVAIAVGLFVFAS